MGFARAGVMDPSWEVSRAASIRIFDRLARGVEEYRRPLVGLAAQTARYVIITAGLITALGTMGIDVSALIAGLGLTGFALGYACRDALSNLLAGVLIIVYQPFKPGQTITVSGKTGKVESMELVDGEGRVEIKIRGANQLGDHVKGTVALVLPIDGTAP